MKKLRYSTDDYFIKITRYEADETIDEEVEVNIFIRFFERKATAFGVIDCIDNNTDNALRFVAETLQYNKNMPWHYAMELLDFYARHYDIMEAYCNDRGVNFYNIETDVNTFYNLYLWRKLYA